jgi:hypothetical protein
MSKDATARSRRAPRKGLDALAERQRRASSQALFPLAGALAGGVVAELRDFREVRALLSASLLRAERDRGPADR